MLMFISLAFLVLWILVLFTLYRDHCNEDNPSITVRDLVKSIAMSAVFVVGFLFIILYWADTLLRYAYPRVNPILNIKIFEKKIPKKDEYIRARKEG